MVYGLTIAASRFATTMPSTSPRTSKEGEARVLSTAGRIGTNSCRVLSLVREGSTGRDESLLGPPRKVRERSYQLRNKRSHGRHRIGCIDLQLRYYFANVPQVSEIHRR